MDFLGAGWDTRLSPAVPSSRCVAGHELSLCIAARSSAVRTRGWFARVCTRCGGSLGIWQGVPGCWETDGFGDEG